MPKTVTWSSARAVDASDSAAQAALEHLEQVAHLYERYVDLAGITRLPTWDELQDPTQYEAPPTDHPFGLVIDGSTPMGLHLTKPG
jgi:hypothetical protein